MFWSGGVERLGLHLLMHQLGAMFGLADFFVSLF